MGQRDDVSRQIAGGADRRLFFVDAAVVLIVVILVLTPLVVHIRCGDPRLNPRTPRYRNNKTGSPIARICRNGRINHAKYSIFVTRYPIKRTMGKAKIIAVGRSHHLSGTLMDISFPMIRPNENTIEGSSRVAHTALAATKRNTGSTPPGMDAPFKRFKIPTSARARDKDHKPNAARELRINCSTDNGSLSRFLAEIWTSEEYS